MLNMKCPVDSCESTDVELIEEKSFELGNDWGSMYAWYRCEKCGAAFKACTDFKVHNIETVYICVEEM